MNERFDEVNNRHTNAKFKRPDATTDNRIDAIDNRLDAIDNRLDEIVALL